MSKILLTAMLLITTTTACAQFNIKIGSGKTFRKDTIDQTVLMVQYEVDGCTDTLSEERFQETMMLEIGKKCSKFYSYTKYVGDSVFAADIANNASQETMIEHAKQFGKSKLNEQTYKRYPVGKVTTLDEIAGDINRLRCEEPEECPQWTLQTDTATILQRRAVEAVRTARTDTESRRQQGALSLYLHRYGAMPFLPTYPLQRKRL